MREPPGHVTDDAVLAIVREHWLPGAASVEHLPVGFGAWHWRADSLFVTLDRLDVHHTSDSLEAAYAGAAELAARGLDLVLAPVPGTHGRFTAPLAGGAVSATPWRDGSAAEGYADAGALARLHAQQPPAGIPRWHPLVQPDLPDDLAARALSPWNSGPHAEAARTAILEHLDDVAAWTADYLRLAATTDPATWIATHGEPHGRNQLVTSAGTLLVDWESLRLAPRERDLRWLAPGTPSAADPELLRMFDLEWRLDEVAQYATWFEAPHLGTESDRVALGGLLDELSRP